MKKRYLSVAILLGVLAVLAGGYYLASTFLPIGGDDGSPDAAQANPEDTVRFSPDKSSADLVSLAVSYMGEEYAIQQKIEQVTSTDSEGNESTSDETVWYLGNRDDFAADSSKLSSLASSFCGLSSTKLVAEAAASVEEFGFGGGAGDAGGTAGDTGAGGTKLSAVFSDGTATELEIGSKNPTNDGYYIRRAGESRIYLFSSYTAERLMIKKPDIADLAIFALEEDDISQMDFSRNGEPVFAASKKQEYVWELSEPIIAPLNSGMLGPLLEAVKDLRASAYEEFGAADLSAFGLDAPRYSLSFDRADGGSAITLLMGNDKSKGSTIYAMLDDGKHDVFTLGLTAFTFLDKPIREIIEAFAYIVNISEVTHIDAEFGGDTASCDITTDPDNDQDKDVFTVNGYDVSKLESDSGKSYFRAFYQAMIGATVYDLDVGAEPSGEPEITYAYTLKSEPYEMRVEFVPKDDRLYYVMRNGEYAGIVVEKRKFDAEDGLYATYAAMIAAAEAAEAAPSE